MRKYKRKYRAHVFTDGVGVFHEFKVYELRDCIHRIKGQSVLVHLEHNSILSGAARQVGLRLSSEESTYDIYRTMYPDGGRVYIYGEVRLVNAPFHIMWRRR